VTDDAIQRQARAIVRMKREGIPDDQAVAKARAMDERHRLDRAGRYVKVPEVVEP
jgi:hypothetical protein